MPAPVSKLDIEAAVKSYWLVSTSKDARQQQDHYSDSALIFTSSSKRLEPAQLVHIRRQREYLGTSTKLRAELGPIEVQLLGADSGVAVYTMQFHAEDKAVSSASGSRKSEEHLQHARVTHVFMRDSNGALKIVHEHISVAEEPKQASG
jgi:ketosteroid isomerase-like protein